MTHQLRLAILPAYLALCLVLGGASAAGLWANTALQLLAIPLIYWSLVAERSTPMVSAGRRLVILLGLAAAVVAIQLIPLPPSIWASLPGREKVVEGFGLMGEELPWMPISLAPGRTAAAALWLLPAVAVLLGIVKLGGFRGRWIAWAVIAVAAASVVVGALQLPGGTQSPWYFYAITNWGKAVGFFANANHLATLLLVTVPFLAAVYLDSRDKDRSAQRRSGMLIVVVGALAVVLIGIALSQSLAGIGLMVPVAGATLLMVASRRRRMPLWSFALVALLVVGTVTAVFTAPFDNDLTKEEADGTSGTRATAFAITARAAADHMPLGAGLGSFPEIYPLYENVDAVDRTYMNHTHGDYLELAMETGLPGLAVLALFLLWWAARTVAIWRSEEADFYARAATIASAAVLAHSAVDYPLRTAAVSALFAACCALMAEPRPRVQRSREAEARPKGRHLTAD